MPDHPQDNAVYEGGGFGAWSASTTETAEVVGAMVKALGELKDVTRDKTAKIKTKGGQEYSYNYADLASYLAEIRPKLLAHGLAVSQTVTNDDGTVTVWTTILHTSGQWITFRPLALSTSTNPQEIGGAMTYARRYALTCALGLASEEDDDGQRAQRGAADRKREQEQAAITYTKAQLDLANLWRDEIESTGVDYLADLRGKFIIAAGGRPEAISDEKAQAMMPWVATVALAIPNGRETVMAVIDKMAGDTPGGSESDAPAADDGVPRDDGLTDDTAAGRA